MLPCSCGDRKGSRKVRKSICAKLILGQDLESRGNGLADSVTWYLAFICRLMGRGSGIRVAGDEAYRAGLPMLVSYKGRVKCGRV